MGLVKVRGRDGRLAYTCTVAPAVSFRVVAAIRISIASPSTSVACTVLPAMRIATDRPRQHTRNDRLRHWGGSLGSIPSVSPLRSRPAKPRIAAWPQRAQPGDAHATGAVRVEIEAGGCGLAQVPQ
jgi:hypothetical protein